MERIPENPDPSKQQKKQVEARTEFYESLKIFSKIKLIRSQPSKHDG
jgi:hypothetical protein